MITVGGIDTYYDYDERQWMYRRLGGGPVRPKQICPPPKAENPDDRTATTSRRTMSLGDRSR